MNPELQRQHEAAKACRARIEGVRPVCRTIPSQVMREARCLAFPTPSMPVPMIVVHPAFEPEIIPSIRTEVRMPWPDWQPHLVCTVRKIQRLVANYYGLQHSVLISERRSNNVCLPRQIAMYLAKEMTPHSMPRIGRFFGGRDHTTVLSAVRKIERLRHERTDVADAIKAVRAMVRSEVADPARFAKSEATP